MSNRQKTNGTAGAVGDRTGRKERYENLALTSVSIACNRWLEERGLRNQETINTQWRRK